MKIKAGCEQAKLLQAHQSVLAIISSALGVKDGGTANHPVPQNMDQMKAAMRAVLGAGSVG